MKLMDLGDSEAIRVLVTDKTLNSEQYWWLNSTEKEQPSREASVKAKTKELFLDNNNNHHYHLFPTIKKEVYTGITI